MVIPSFWHHKAINISSARRLAEASDYSYALVISTLRLRSNAAEMQFFYFSPKIARW
jgi:hypothetical protein